MEIKKVVVKETTWKRIAKDVREGKTAKYQGTELEITLKNGTVAILAVADVDHYQKNELVVAFREYLPERRKMNEDGTGRIWKSSDIRRWLNEEYFKLLPDDLCKIISKKKTVQKIDGVRYECKDYLFLPSEMELFGNCRFSENNQEDKQIAYYRDKRNRSRRIGGDGFWDFGWTSSANKKNKKYFCNVNCYGGCESSFRSNSELGVAPLFVIR